VERWWAAACVAVAHFGARFDCPSSGRQVTAFSTCICLDFFYGFAYFLFAVLLIELYSLIRFALGETSGRVQRSSNERP